MLELSLLLLGFIAASGFFAMIDSAILSITMAEAEVLDAKRYWGAKELKSLLRHQTRAIVVVVIFTNVVNILGPILVGNKAVELFGSHVIGIITAILTFATIIFSEIIPKALGAHYAPRISLLTAPVINAFIIILYPLVIAFEKFVRLFKSGKRKFGTEEQIRALANVGSGAGLIDADEQKLIHRAFVLNDRYTRDVMTAAHDIKYINQETSIRQSARMVIGHNFSRYPIVKHDLNDVTGYVLSRDVLEALADGQGSRLVADVVRSIQSVPASMRCDDLLNFLRKNLSQMAIVTDEGKTVGLVTLEDVLEELIGEIKDEGDLMSV